MSAEPSVRRQRALQIHCVAGTQPAKIAPAECFRHDIRRKYLRPRKGRSRQAYTVDGDAVPGPDTGKNNGAKYGNTVYGSVFFQKLHTAFFFDNSGKHGGPSEKQAETVCAAANSIHAANLFSDYTEGLRLMQARRIDKNAENR